MTSSAAAGVAARGIARISKRGVRRRRHVISPYRARGFAVISAPFRGARRHLALVCFRARCHSALCAPLAARLAFASCLITAASNASNALLVCVRRGRAAANAAATRRYGVMAFSAATMRKRLPASSARSASGCAARHIITSRLARAGCARSAAPASRALNLRVTWRPRGAYGGAAWRAWRRSVNASNKSGVSRHHSAHNSSARGSVCSLFNDASFRACLLAVAAPCLLRHRFHPIAVAAQLAPARHQTA